MGMRISRGFIILLAVLIALAVFPACLGMSENAEAASVTCKSKHYVTTTINKAALKKGKTAKVTVKVTNTTGKAMKNLNIKVKLPAELKKTSGTLTKTKASLAKKKSFSFSFYVKATKKVNFYKKVTSSKAVAGTKTKVITKNMLKAGKKNRYTTVTMTFKKPTATKKTTKKTTTTTKKTTTPTTPAPSVVTTPSSHAQAMVDLLSDMSKYAKARNAKFAMIPNGGYNLYAPWAATAANMLASIDGALIEDVFSDDDSEGMQEALANAANNGKKTFSIEYDEPNPGNNVIVSYDARDIDSLDEIPAFVNGTSYNVNSLADVKNFLAILDPTKNSKEEYFAALKNTDYDLIFIDLFFDSDDQQPLTAAEVNALKKKRNGGKRIVCTYMSVGEAESYRYYWLPAWDNEATRPAWIAEENPQWKRNYKVCYWAPEWQKILYGNSSAYLDQILAAGFDGVYLDVIDAYEYFEEQSK